MSDQESNILVAIRVRPLNGKEVNSNKEFDIVRVEDNLIIILDPIECNFADRNQKMLDVYHRSKEQRYAFDKIYRDQSSEGIYVETCQQLITPVMKGFNATVFAYGPTGTGKTFTMVGNYQNPGLMTLTTADLFEYARNDNLNNYDIKITYVEIYNEVIRDLLVAKSDHLDLREDPIKGIQIAGVTEYKVESVNNVMSLLLEGNKRRTTESTNANLTSSRSHAVFQIFVNCTSKTQNTSTETLMGKLSLIDLAGSERGTVTENRGIRLREGAKINQSLLALANCINALGDKNKKGYFVPYRDSKLTRVLKDSLGGNSKTVMINCVSPASSQFEETINTLKYANRAKNIKTKPVSNKKLVSRHIAEYKGIINDLRSEIEQLKVKLQSHLSDNLQDQSVNNQEEQSLQRQYSDSQVCICQRSEDQKELKQIQEEIFENFQDRIQLRRALMEVEEQNAMNTLEVKKKTTVIAMWKQQQQDGIDKDNIPEDIKQDIRQIRTLKMSTEQNRVKKELMNIQLIENIANAKKIRDKIPQRIKWKEKRNFLELVIKNHVLELQNIELEINLQIQDKTIDDLKQIIEQQRKIIQQNDNNNMQNQNDSNNFIGGDNYSNMDDIDNDLEELIMEDSSIMDNQQNDNEEDEDDDGVQQDIDAYKDMIEKSVSKLQIPELQQQQNQQDRSGKNKNGNGKHVKNTPSIERFEINGQGYQNQNQEEDSTTLKQNNNNKNFNFKKKKESTKKIDNGNKDLNSINIMGQGMGIQNSNQGKGMPVIKQNNANGNKERDSLKNRDLSSLNLQGKNLVLPQLGDKNNLQSNKRGKK